MTSVFATIMMSRVRPQDRRTVLGWSLATILGVSGLLATPAAATDIMAGQVAKPGTSLAAGIKAAHAGQFADAITILRPHAEEGRAKAHYALGLIYSKARGAGLPARPDQAHHHFQQAASTGHIGAIFELAFQYERGIGAAADMNKALQLYRIAAHHNHLNAQFNLAVILSRGGTVKPDLREAYFWALAAQHRARTHPRGPLTVERLTKLVRQIRSALPHQAASQATRAATRLTGQPV